MPSTRRQVRRVALIVGATMFILLVGLWIHCQQQATATFTRHEQDLSKAPPFNRTIANRPILFEPELEGDAWDSYAPILPALANLQGKWTWSNMPEEEHERFLALSRPVVDGLRKAFSQHKLTLPPNQEDWIQSSASFSRGLMGSCSYLIRIAGGWHVRKKDDDALDALFLNLATASDLGKIPSFGIWPKSWSIGDETRSLQHLQQFMQEHSLTSSEIGSKMQVFDRLLLSRCGLHKGVMAHEALNRKMILDWERDGQVGFYGTGPSWRYLFSYRLERAAALNRIEQVWEQLAVLDRTPSHKWHESLKPLMDRKGSEFVPLEHVNLAYEQELGCLRLWTSVPVALALARFQLDRGTEPTALTELVPEYLKVLPRCPEGDEDFKYKPGEFWCNHSSSRWKVSRRK